MKENAYESVDTKNNLGTHDSVVKTKRKSMVRSATPDTNSKRQSANYKAIYQNNNSFSNYQKNKKKLGKSLVNESLINKEVEFEYAGSSILN